MTIAQEEIFGPVLVVIPFDDDDDAVRIANDSVYGLSGGVFSGFARTLAARRRARPHRDVRRQRRHADRPGRHAFRGLQAQRDRPPERARRVRPVPRDQVGGVADAPVGRPAVRVSDHDPVLRHHGYHSLRIKRRRRRDARRQLLRARRARGTPEIFRYRPGQFCTFRVHVDGDEQLRSYSMSSAPETDRDLTVTVKRVTGGLVSNWFLDNLSEGRHASSSRSPLASSARRSRTAPCSVSAAAAASRR